MSVNMKIIELVAAQTGSTQMCLATQDTNQYSENCKISAYFTRALTIQRNRFMLRLLHQTQSPIHTSFRGAKGSMGLHHSPALLGGPGTPPRPNHNIRTRERKKHKSQPRPGLKMLGDGLRLQRIKGLQHTVGRGP